MEEGNVTIRLKHFLKSQGLTPSVFADTCGIPRPSLSQLLNGRNKKISDVHITLIHNAYPRLSIMWLLFGEGNMLSGEDPEDTLYSDQGNFSEDGDKIGFENQKNRPAGKEEYHFLNPERGNSELDYSKSADNQLIYEYIRREKRDSQAMENRVNPRKVVRITVFYDDNSYESFGPVREA